MKDAKTLLLEFLAAVTRGQNAAALFAEDGAVELPFLHSLGIPWRHQGRQAISELQDSLAGLYLDFAFKPESTVRARLYAGRVLHAILAGRIKPRGRLRLDRLTATARLPNSFPHREVAALLAESRQVFVRSSWQK